MVKVAAVAGRADRSSHAGHAAPSHLGAASTPLTVPSSRAAADKARAASSSGEPPAGALFCLS